MKSAGSGDTRKKQACDSCARKKRSCTGETPCQRCQRNQQQCTYSARAAVSRGPATTEFSGKKAKPCQRPASTAPLSSTPARPPPPPPPIPPAVSSATLISGLRESRWLSIFLEHCAPMYPCVNDATIRDGLMHEFVGLANRKSQMSLRGAEAMRGQALSCSLFSCVALGGLMSGCAPAAVTPHILTAHACLGKFCGELSDGYAVSALILYAMASELVGGGIGPGTEYRRSMEAARATFEKLPSGEKDPVLSAVLSYFMVLERLPFLQHVESAAAAVTVVIPSAYPASHNMGSVSGGGGGGGGGGGDGHEGVQDGDSGAAATAASATAISAVARERSSCTSFIRCKTAQEEQAFDRALATRADITLVMTDHPLPVYVVTDAQLLTIRFSRDRGDVGTRLWHLHEFASCALQRFTKEGKGAVAILALIDPLMGVKVRLGRLDGLLATAELASSMLHRCPGLVRIYHRHVAHLCMATYRLHGRREAYDALRILLANTIEQDTPAFEDMAPNSRFCEHPVCAVHLAKLLEMKA